MCAARATVQEGGIRVGEAPFASHEVRLSAVQWVVALALMVAALALLPRLWQAVEKFEPGPDYRIPYVLSNDYWFFGRYSRWASSKGKMLVIGDSVMWGQYVGEDQTLPHCLNALVGEDPFANMGVDGMHPAALTGLVEHYGRAISGCHVVVHCNLLWMSSKKHDLQVEKEFQFNHPRLAPQFVPAIPCYRASYSDRMGVVVGRMVPLLSWADHLRLAYFDQMDVSTWTLGRPYANPLAAPSQGLPPPDAGPRHEPISWMARGLTRQDFPWVEFETSFQWRSFRRLLAILGQRRNEVFVIVGPFNEHMLEAQSLRAYLEGRNGVAAWLQEQGIPHYVPPALPSECYADASHPLGRGYAMLAEELFEDDGFMRFCARARDESSR